LVRIIFFLQRIQRRRIEIQSSPDVAWRNAVLHQTVGDEEPPRGFRWIGKPGKRHKRDMHRRHAFVAGARMLRGAANGADDRRVDRFAVGNRKQREYSSVFAFQRTVVQAFGEDRLRAKHDTLAFEAHAGAQLVKAPFVLPTLLKLCDFLLQARIP
jgi:hypothetical protein